MFSNETETDGNRNKHYMIKNSSRRFARRIVQVVKFTRSENPGRQKFGW